MSINGKTKLYGILGNPVSHSLSPVMHNAAFAATGINGAYLPFPALDIAEAVTGIRGLGIQGASVTIPYKEKVMELLDIINPVAQNIGAVNTIVRDGDTLSGFNTDWLGATSALEEKITIHGRKVVILGAGGSARAIGFGMQERGADFVLASRTESRGRALAGELDCRWTSLRNTEDISGDILINATSVGMVPGIENSPVADSVLPQFQVVMDIVYAPLKTRLLATAEKAGCKIVNGLEMLLYQGVAQFEMWTGKKAPVDIMRQALLEALKN
jgi:shikimate dehydrogenase